MKELTNKYVRFFIISTIALDVAMGALLLTWLVAFHRESARNRNQQLTSRFTNLSLAYPQGVQIEMVHTKIEIHKDTERETGSESKAAGRIRGEEGATHLLAASFGRLTMR